MLASDSNAIRSPTAHAARDKSRANLAVRDTRIARLSRGLVCPRVAVAAMRISRAYRFAVRDLRNDAMRDPILSGPFSRRIQMESARLHSALRRNRLRCLRTGDIGDARAAFADPFFDATGENIFACLSRLCARAKLDLFTGTLAQFLNCRASGQTPASLIAELQNLCPSVFICG